MNIAKDKLKDDSRGPQPTAGFVGLVEDRVLDAWRELKGDAQPK